RELRRVPGRVPRLPEGRLERRDHCAGPRRTPCAPTGGFCACADPRAAPFHQIQLHEIAGVEADQRPSRISEMMRTLSGPPIGLFIRAATPRNSLRPANGLPAGTHVGGSIRATAATRSVAASSPSALPRL